VTAQYLLLSGARNNSTQYVRIGRATWSHGSLGSSKTIPRTEIATIKEAPGKAEAVSKQLPKMRCTSARDDSDSGSVDKLAFKARRQLEESKKGEGF